MVETTRCHGFTSEAAGEILGLAQARMQHLDGDLSPNDNMFATKHRAHAALTERLDDSVAILEDLADELLENFRVVHVLPMVA